MQLLFLELIMVYYLSWKTGEMPCLPADWEKYLPSFRVKKAWGYKQEKDRITCVLSYILLRFAVYKETHETEQLQMITDENGKPHETHERYFYNISHCDTAVACVIDVSKCGADVQDFRPVRKNVVKKVCTAEEQQRLQDCGYDEKLFAAFWAGKEAYGKYTGNGIGYELHRHAFCPEIYFPQSIQCGPLWVQTVLCDTCALSVCSCEKQQVLKVEYDTLTKFLAVLDETVEKL